MHQAIFALTDAAQWSPSYGGIDFVALYNFLVDYFEDSATEEEAAHSEDLLKWWNEYVFLTC